MDVYLVFEAQTITSRVMDVFFTLEGAERYLEAQVSKMPGNFEMERHRKPDSFRITVREFTAEAGRREFEFYTRRFTVKGSPLEALGGQAE